MPSYICVLPVLMNVAIQAVALGFGREDRKLKISRAPPFSSYVIDCIDTLCWGQDDFRAKADVKRA